MNLIEKKQGWSNTRRNMYYFAQLYVERHCPTLGCFFLSENRGPKMLLFEVRNFIKPTPWLMEMWLSVTDNKHVMRSISTTMNQWKLFAVTGTENWIEQRPKSWRMFDWSVVITWDCIWRGIRTPFCPIVSAHPPRGEKSEDAPTKMSGSPKENGRC